MSTEEEIVKRVEEQLADEKLIDEVAEIVESFLESHGAEEHGYKTFFKFTLDYKQLKESVSVDSPTHNAVWSTPQALELYTEKGRAHVVKDVERKLVALVLEHKIPMLRIIDETQGYEMYETRVSIVRKKVGKRLKYKSNRRGKGV